MKKILSLILVTCLLLSCSATVFADGGHSTKVRYVGEGESEWELDVPSQLAPGESGNVILTGTWDSVTTVNVTADETVTLTNDVDESTKTLGITFANINQVGNLDNAIEVTKSISVSEITGGIFGVWEGIFNYYVTVDLVEKYIVPSGATFYSNIVPIEDSYFETYPIGYYGDSTKIVYEEGDSFNGEINVGDTFVYGDYEYKYGIKHEIGIGLIIPSGEKGWGVFYIGDTDTPGEILKEIFGEPVTCMEGTFAFCNIETAPIIHENIKNINQAFTGCSNLKGVVEINSTNIENYYATFENTEHPIELIGTCTKLSDIATSSNNCEVTVQGN